MIQLGPHGELLTRYAASEIRRAIIQQRAEQDLLGFARAFWRVCDPEEPFIAGWPIEAIADHLMAVTDGHIKRLLINVPPGFTKSLMTDVFWPAWEWGPMGMPWLRYVTAAYTSSLTRRDNGRFRRVLLDSDYRAIWGDQFMLTKVGEVKIENSRTGWKLATSVEGVGTGERGNRIIIDDPNNPKDVESDLVREGTNLWLREVMPDRLNNMREGAIVLIQQRTHERDASGTTLDVLGRDYVHLMIPMEYEPARHCVTVLGWEDPRGLDDDGKRLPGFVLDEDGEIDGVVPESPVAQQAGTLAWPRRFPVGEVQSLKTVKGPYAYSGQYQQLPVPRGGGLIQPAWWNRWASDSFPDFGSVIASLDTAIKEREQNDWNALTVWGAFAEDDSDAPLLMLRAAWRMRGSLGEIAKRAGDTCKEIGVDTLLIEDKTRGHDVAAEVRRLFGMSSFMTVLVPPQGDKIARVIACQPLWSGDALGTDEHTAITTWGGGVIYAPTDKQWADEVITECEKFPRAEHDDYVDSCTQALLWMRRNGVVLRRAEHMAEEEERKKFENIKRLTGSGLAERYNV